MTEQAGLSAHNIHRITMIGRIIPSSVLSRHASADALKKSRLVVATPATQSRRISSSVRRFSDKAEPPKDVNPEKALTWWNDPKAWGTAGAIAGWGMSGAAIYDAFQSSPDVISLNMTGVLLVYSSLFARWAFIVKPQNLLLAACHVANIGAQSNQLRRAVEYKKENGKDEEVNELLKTAAAVIAGGLACVLGGPTLQGMLVNANLGPISTIASADAGPL